MDLKTVETTAVVGVSILAINLLGNITNQLLSILKKKKENGHLDLEEQRKEISRIKIDEVHSNLGLISETFKIRESVFFEMKNKIDSMEKIVTKDSDGIPLIYNKGLESAVRILGDNTEKLSDNVFSQTTAINELTRNLNGKYK